MVRKESTFRSPGTQRTPKGVVQGNILVDPNTGDPICVKEDSEGQLRLCVDTNINLDSVNVDVDLDPDTDGVHIGNVANGNTLIINDDGSLNANVVVDAKGGDNIAISAHPLANQIREKLAETLPTTATKEIFSYTSLSDNTRVRRVKCTASTSCTFTLKINGTVEDVLRSSPMQRNISFIFDEHLALLSADEITVEAQVETFFSTKAPYTTFTNLEGYLCS